MGIDPKSLKAFAATAPNQGARKLPDPSPVDEGTGVQDEDDKAFEEFDDSSYASLLPVLEQHADEVSEAADELDSDTLALLDEPISEDEQEILAEGFNGLDRKLQKALRESLGEIPVEHAIRLAEHLENEDLIEDSERVSGWLYRLGEWLAEEAA